MNASLLPSITPRPMMLMFFSVVLMMPSLTPSPVESTPWCARAKSLMGDGRKPGAAARVAPDSVEGDVAQQFGAHEIDARLEDRSAACRTRCANGSLDGISVERRPVACRAEFADIEPPGGWRRAWSLSGAQSAGRAHTST